MQLKHLLTSCLLADLTTAAIPGNTGFVKCPGESTKLSLNNLAVIAHLVYPPMYSIHMGLEGSYKIPQGTKVVLTGTYDGEQVTETIEYCSFNACPQEEDEFSALIQYRQLGNPVFTGEAKIEMKTPDGVMLACASGRKDQSVVFQSQHERTLNRGHGRKVRITVQDDESVTVEL